MQKQIALLALLTVTLASLGLTLAKVDDADNPPRAALDEYLSFLELPNPKPIRDELFHKDIVGYWSRGQTITGRKATVSEIKTAVEEDGKLLKSLKFDVVNADMGTSEHNGWIGATVNINAELNNGQKFVRTIRMTLIFTENNDQWQIVHEHSSLLNEKTTDEK